jgi:hypothetical protein
MAYSGTIGRYKAGIGFWSLSVERALAWLNAFKQAFEENRKNG